MVQARLEELDLPDILTFNDGNRVENKDMLPRRRAGDYPTSRKSGLRLFAAGTPDVYWNIESRDDMAFANKAVHSVVV